MNEFAHLHCHSQSSVLDGLSTVTGMARQAKALNQPAIALTDHALLSGLPDFFTACQDAGVKSILGNEIYVSDGPMGEKNDTFHLTLLAETQEGYNNLLKISSAAHISGFYRKARVDKEFLAQHSNGLICLSGCAAAELSTYILASEEEKAKGLIDWYRSIFGNRFYLEVQHHSLSFDDQLVTTIMRYSKEFGLPVVASNDSHYVQKKDALTHQVLLCVQTQAKMSDPKKMDYGSQEYYLKSYDEMEQLFGNIPKALSNTLEIAERCNAIIPYGRLELPSPLPPEINALTHLKQQLYSGLLELYGNPLPQEVIDRVKYELSVIEPAGYINYFLLVSDIIGFARKNGIAVGVRGSVGGSIVAYGLRITDIDPIRYKLPFERFLNPDRISMPDVDIDISDIRRQEVVEYITHKYGKENVAQIMTFGTMGARATIRDVGRAMELPLSDTDRIAKLIPFKNPDQTKVHIKDAFERVPEFQEEYEKNPLAKVVIDTAKDLEGVYRSIGTHAAGIVISKDSLTNHVPLYTAPRVDGAILSQYTMGPLEAVGLLKIDLLGLRTLSIMEDAGHAVGIEDLSSIPINDQSIFDLIGTGNTSFIFQIGESQGIRQLCKKDKPQTMEELAVLIALYRPGPLEFLDSYVRRHHHEETPKYPHPAVKEALEDTFGIPVYQEQIMQMVSNIAGFTPGKADSVRKAMGKKQHELMAKYRAEFIDGAQNHGTTLDEAAKLWDIINAFSGYGFNRSHSIAYAIMACRTAYLKANYPLEYMRVVLTAERNDLDRVVEAITECRRLGIEILPPDINKSEKDFIIEGGAIRYGLAAIKGIGDLVADTITAFRKRDGEYESLTDIVSRHSTKIANKGVFDSLAMAGALDQFADPKQIVTHSEDIVKFMQKRRQMINVGQLELFEDTSEISLPEMAPITEKERQRYEKEVLGTWLRNNPLDAAQELLEDTIPITELHSLDIGNLILTGGIVTNVCPTVTKKGDKMARIVLSDTTSSISGVLFPRTYASYKQYLRHDEVVKVSAKIQEWNDQRELIVDGVVPLNERKPIAVESFTVDMTMVPTGNRERDNATFAKIRSILQKHPGDDVVRFWIQDGENKRSFPIVKSGIKLDSTLESALNWASLSIEVSE